MILDCSCNDDTIYKVATLSSSNGESSLLKRPGQSAGLPMRGTNIHICCTSDDSNDMTMSL